MLLSVIIPTWNRPLSLSDCLQGIAAQVCELEFEVVVVDDGGDQDLRPVIEALQPPFPWRLLEQRRAGPAAARNSGAQEARGQYLAFLDDDCIPEAGWLEELARSVHRHPQAAVGGSTVNALSRNLFAEASQLLVDHLYQYLSQPEFHSDRFFASNNLVVPRAAFWEAGGFDEQFRTAAGEDREFCSRWVRQGREMVYQPAIRIQHHHNLQLSSFVGQHFRYGRAAWRYWALRGNADGSSRKFFPIEFYLGMLTRPVSAHGVAPKALLLTGLLVLAQLTNAGGYFWEWGRARL